MEPPSVRKLVACNTCPHRENCIPAQLTNSDLHLLSKVARFNIQLKENDKIFRSEQSFVNVYILKYGTIKTISAGNRIGDVVTGLLYPGEFIGLDAIHSKKYNNDAVALEHSYCCSFPYDFLIEVSSRDKNISKFLFSLLSQKILKEQSYIFSRGSLYVEERIILFLVSLSKYQYKMGYSQLQFQLKMSRSDIASLLGMAAETVTRIFNYFSKQGFIEIKNRDIKILNLNYFLNRAKEISGSI